ncbi:MAG: PKD domain-containing protein [Thermoanaerobaculia bacterium]
MFGVRSVLSFAAITAALVGLSVPAGGTTIVMPSDDALIAKSPVIAIGRVLRTEAIPHQNGVATETELSVEAVLKGSVGARIVIREAGGMIGDRATVVFGSPHYRVGERTLVFLSPRDDGSWQTRDLFIGKFTERQTIRGTRVWHRENSMPRTQLLDQRLGPATGGKELRDGAEFTRYISERTRGRSSSASYLRDFEPLVPAREVAPTFSMIDEPLLFRWFEFDIGEPLTWHRVGTQPGYESLGDHEVTLGLVAWTRPGSSAIRLAYEGESTASPGGLTVANGINEVLLGDPLGEIDGTWTRGGSGVVGRGGFSAARMHGSWTAPFDGGGTHHAGTWNDVWEVLEGNLVIQDGVSPVNGISSATLAEILAHELGHTLGFGHSENPAALMYPTITTAGAVLRADDEEAARWLYPAPGTVMPPSAPAALRVLSRGDGVTLGWVDSASNENGFTIYLARVGDPFTPAVQLASNSTMARMSGLIAGAPYRGYVVAYNTAGESTRSNVATFTPSAEPPLFSVSPEYGVAGETTFTYEDLTPGSFSRVWNFGDGQSSIERVASHVYATPGTYEVELRVQLESGIETADTFPVTVAAPMNPLVAAFSYTPTAPAVGDAVVFRDDSSGPYTSRTWHFGDGSTSTDEVVTKHYATAGRYRTVLTISDGERIATAAKDVIVASPPAFRSVLPVATSTSGLGGALWETELVLHNGGGEAAKVQLTLLPSAGGELRSAALTIPAGTTFVYDNVLEDLFRVAAGAGAVVVEAHSDSSTPSLKIMSRTFTRFGGGTVNQLIPDEAISSGDGFRFITGIPKLGAFRTNLGFVNLDTSSRPVLLTLLDGAGVELGEIEFALPPLSFRQVAAGDIFATFGKAQADEYAIAMRAHSDTHAYASIVDNRSHDPAFVPAVPAPRASETWIPIAAQTEGAAGVFWQSDLGLFNPFGHTISVDVALVGPAGDTALLPLQLAPRASSSLPEVVTYLGGATRGGIRIRSTDGTQIPIVRGRAYTTRGERGTVGQSIPPADDSQFGSSFVLAGLPHGGGWRSNVGLINRANRERHVTARLLDVLGSQLAATEIRLAPTSHWQSSLGQTFPGTAGPTHQHYTVVLTIDEGDVFAYGSYVDNISGDPVYVGGE